VRVSKKNHREILDLYLLHREYVRRNPEYANAYGKVHAIKQRNDLHLETALLAEQWGLSLSCPLPNPSERPGYDLKQLKTDANLTISSLFGDVMQTDPIETDAVFIAQEHLSTTLHSLSQELKGFLVLLYLSENSKRPYGLDVIDLRRPKEEILKGIDNLIEETRKHQRQRPGKNRRQSIGGPKTKGFDYLKVYDLRNDGLAFGEIANQIWGIGAGTDDEMQAKASKYFRRARANVKNPPLLRMFAKQLARRRKKRAFDRTYSSSLPLVWGKRAWLTPVPLKR